MAYRSLNSAQIITTLERLTKRIDDRFPGAGLSAVAKEFLALGRFCAAEADELGKPHWPIRIAAVLLIVIVVAGLTNGLTSKIWQKLTILDAEMLARRGRVAGGL